MPHDDQPVLQSECIVNTRSVRTQIEEVERRMAGLTSGVDVRFDRLDAAVARVFVEVDRTRTELTTRADRQNGRTERLEHTVSTMKRPHGPQTIACEDVKERAHRRLWLDDHTKLNILWAIGIGISVWIMKLVGSGIESLISQILTAGS